MTASGPEQDLVAGTSRRAPPETGVKSTTATVGTRQSREEAPLLPAPVAADQAESCAAVRRTAFSVGPVRIHSHAASTIESDSNPAAMITEEL